MSIFSSKVARARRRLQAVRKAAAPALQAEFEAEAEKLNNEQRRLVPKDERKAEKSIGYKPLPAGRIGVKVVAGDDTAYHVPFIEFSTVKMAAQPFFFPPYRLGKKPRNRRLGRALGKAVREAAKQP